MNSAMKKIRKRPANTLLPALAASLVLTLGGCSDKSTPAADKIAPALVTASSSTAAEQPKFAVDGDVTTAWSAGAGAPSSILLDLGQAMTISKVRLNVSQTPPGATTHTVTAGATPDSLTLIGTLDGSTTDSQWLELSKSVSNIRYVKIETLKSPSWVAWREIEIYK